jgi:hypothetical protein
MASQKCICDPGLSDADCILTSKWPPVPTTDEGIPQAQLSTEEEEEEQESPGSIPPTGGLGRAPGAQTTEDKGTQP